MECDLHRLIPSEVSCLFFISDDSSRVKLNSRQENIMDNALDKIKSSMKEYVAIISVAISTPQLKNSLYSNDNCKMILKSTSFFPLPLSLIPNSDPAQPKTEFIQSTSALLYY